MNYTVNDHTFVLCAYQESPFLADCINSLLHQTVRGNLLLSTSTPCDYIAGLAEQYHIPLVVNPGKGDMADNWNFGYSQAKTPLVTIAHQDDVYLPAYLEKVLACINTSKHPLIAFTDYGELRGNDRVFSNSLLKVKRMLLSPLRVRAWQGSKWVRRRSLSFGCGICCPSVTFVRPNLPDPVFQPGYRSNLDWQAWERLSKLDGDFLYCDQPLMLHRIHDDSETSHILADKQRGNEDFEIFCKFWPPAIAKPLVHLYSLAEKSNRTEVTSHNRYFLYFDAKKIAYLHFLQIRNVNMNDVREEKEIFMCVLTTFMRINLQIKT